MEYGADRVTKMLIATGVLWIGGSFGFLRFDLLILVTSLRGFCHECLPAVAYQQANPK